MLNLTLLIYVLVAAVVALIIGDMNWYWLIVSVVGIIVAILL